MDEKGTGKIPDHKGLGWRVSLSIISGVGWLCFIILWLAFFAGDHSAYRNLAVLLASIMLIGGILGIPWSIYGFRHQTDRERWQWTTPGFKLRVAFSIFFFAFMFFVLIYWLWFYAGEYNIYQNIAVFIVLLLIFGGVMGSSWASWGIKYGDRFDEPDEAPSACGKKNERGFVPITKK